MLVLEGGVTTSSRQDRLLLDTQARHARGHPIRKSQHLRGVHLKVKGVILVGGTQLLNEEALWESTLDYT